MPAAIPRARVVGGWRPAECPAPRALPAVVWSECAGPVGDGAVRGCPPLRAVAPVVGSGVAQLVVCTRLVPGRGDRRQGAGGRAEGVIVGRVGFRGDPLMDLPNGPVRRRARVDESPPFSLDVGLEHVIHKVCRELLCLVEQVHRSGGSAENGIEDELDDVDAIRPGALPDDRVEIEHSGLFRDVVTRDFDWEISYTADEYLRLLDTFSGHIAMHPWQRDRLYSEIRRRLARRPDGRLRRGWGAVLHVARRTGPEPTS